MKGMGAAPNRRAILGGWLGEGNAYPKQNWDVAAPWEARKLLQVSDHSSSRMLKKSASLSCSFGLFGLSGLFSSSSFSCSTK